LASQSSATVVVLMGMHKLNEIVSIYQKNRTDDLPVAIIQNGTTKQEKKVVGTIKTISQLVEKQQISSPAIIIIGEVVRHSPKLTALLEREEANNQFVFQNQNLKP
jgi:uroporphyrin-III C-methyltransferase